MTDEFAKGGKRSVNIVPWRRDCFASNGRIALPFLIQNMCLRKQDILMHSAVP